MRRSIIEELSIRGKSIRENLTIISTLIFLFPSITVTYILFNTQTTVQFDTTHIIMLVLTLFLVLMGMIILRQVLDEVVGVSTDLKRVGQGNKVVFDLNKTTSELQEISRSFNHLLENQEINSELLEKQAEKLNREINERRLVEKELSDYRIQLAHSERLTVLGEMASGIAHEINQPLAIISLTNEVLKEYFTNRKDVSFENKAVLGIEVQINRAFNIITNIRAFARSGGGDMELVNLQKSVDLALFFFNEQFRLHDINLSFTYDKNLPLVKANAQKIEQVVVNLVNNSRYAVEKKAVAAPDDYEMEISIKLYRDPDRHAVILEVSDNGIGMTAKEREHCLEPFFTRKNVDEGTGLGLSITHNIVNEIGGTIKIDSEENKGCTFAIMFQGAEDNHHTS